MRIVLDTDSAQMECSDGTSVQSCGLYTREAFEILSRQWLRVGWNQKYPYTFSWLGRPIIQLPEDMVRLQEVIYQIRPDVIVETGVAHGGSLIFSAGLCKILGHGKVVGVDLEIRPHNRQAIEQHELSSLITLVEGDSVASDTVATVKRHVGDAERVLVVLDSCHSYSHVLAELETYGPIVTPGSYVAATDGIMADLDDVPRGSPEWRYDNPVTAIREFLSRHDEFVEEQPNWPFRESDLMENVTHWPHAWLRKRG